MVAELPLRVRLRAWWEGYDLDALRELLARRQPEAESDDAPRLAVADAAASRDAVQQRSLVDPAKGWTAEQIAAAAIVWGSGSLSPRGDAELKAIAARAGLGPQSRVLHLGAELGGVAALLEHGLGCRPVCFETNPSLVAVAEGRVAQLGPADPPKLPRVEFILVDGIAERADPLTTLLRNQSSGLVLGGSLVLRSLVLANERAALSTRYRDWANAEPVRPRLRSPEELGRLLLEARLVVTESLDTADAYAAEVERCWGDAIDRIRAIHRDPAGRAIIPVLLAECERWYHRIALIRDGVIGVRQYWAERRDRVRR